MKAIEGSPQRSRPSDRFSLGSATGSHGMVVSWFLEAFSTTREGKDRRRRGNVCGGGDGRSSWCVKTFRRSENIYVFLTFIHF